MGNWNLRKFKALCLNRGLDRLSFYTESLAFKYNAALYHKDIIERKMQNVKDKGMKLPPEKIAALDLEIAFEFDALMLTLNSTWDILGQLLNERFIRPKIDTTCVSFDRVSDPTKAHRQSIPPEIQSLLDSIRGNCLYSMIKDYVNVSKHRYAIKGEIEVDFGETPTRVSYKTQEFEYKRGQRRRLTPDKAFKCLEFVGKSVDQVGAEVQKE